MAQPDDAQKGASAMRFFVRATIPTVGGNRVIIALPSIEANVKKYGDDGRTG
jgi:hypothetical protein